MLGLQPALCMRTLHRDNSGSPSPNMANVCSKLHHFACAVTPFLAATQSSLLYNEDCRAERGRESLGCLCVIGGADAVEQVQVNNGEADGYAGIFNHRLDARGEPSVFFVYASRSLHLAALRNFELKNSRNASSPSPSLFIMTRYARRICP